MQRLFCYLYSNLPAGKWKVIIAIEFVRIHCKSIELVIRRVHNEFAHPRTSFPCWNSCCWLCCYYYYYFLWPPVYELSKAALSTSCIHKLVRIVRLVSSLLEFWRPFSLLSCCRFIVFFLNLFAYLLNLIKFPRRRKNSLVTGFTFFYVFLRFYCLIYDFRFERIVWILLSFF